MSKPISEIQTAEHFRELTEKTFDQILLADFSDIDLPIREDGVGSTENDRIRRATLETLNKLFVATDDTVTGLITASQALTSSPQVRYIHLTDSNNIVISVPAEPTDGEQIHLCVKNEVSDPLGRVQLNIGTKTINGGPPPFGAASTGFENNGSGGAAVDASIAEMGGTVVSRSGVTVGTWSPRSGSNSASFNSGGHLEYQLTAGPGGGTVSHWVRTGSSTTHTIRINGVVDHTINGSSDYSQAWTSNLIEGINTIRLSQSGDSGLAWEMVDDFSTTNTQQASEASWTDVTPWEMSPGGFLSMRWSSVLETWKINSRLFYAGDF